ncbi:putative remorin [Helianthus annuus]|nr:putative remorin [Helianthus annuus]KAJ0885190.1 putative remorin [Helianthus annuus]
MDLKTSNYLQEPTSFFHSHGGVRVRKDPDPMGKTDGAPSTLGRPGFSFTVGSRKSVPSKWDDAEKWLINGHDSPSNFMVKQCGINGPVIKPFESSDLVLKDKFTNEVEPIFKKLKCLGTMEGVQEVKNRDAGTEMTPVESSTTTRCPTPLKSLSPPRHNTPESRLLLQGMVDESNSQLECHLANKLQQWTPFDAVNSNWSSMEEEEAEISKSLRHFEINNGFLEGISGPRPSAWEEKEMSEPCVRYQIKEAKIQAWVNLQKAKAEAESKKLEVKIQKMRSKHEEKMMKKMTIVHRKAEELRTAAQLDHLEMIAKQNKPTDHPRPSVQFSGHHGSCGCLISNR